ncbi:pyrroline-5-carboxylate reductase family protein [Albidovulum sediminicola]|uniref:Pyrroline-5-carboxylate reductase n=1 Tax=Albidovulum sediminicola TaxID=2984331 RepID=A0ABT2YZ17_9RHOB|nr:pyrroline-5-carboxylate reductase dimerization domain-containing protein [Defluviimonas sp. WL0075]MCV2864137.1 NAD(P)-binding domain-containing protein [Defluviimonas sp. WL0075]
MAIEGKVGIIGGNGQLGSAIARGMLAAGALKPEDLWISARSGRAPALAAWPGVTVTADNAALAAACDTVILSVPPAQAGAIAIAAPDRLVISVMAGVPLRRLGDLTGAARIVRAMSSPAAERRLAYSPWLATEAVSARDRDCVRAIFGAVGLTDEVTDEDQIDQFTAMTGPVPGFVALFADAMIRHAEARGIAPQVASRAIRQLFLASSTIMDEADASPAEQVRAMVDYAGTTAAGITAMEALGLADVISRGLDAAATRARMIGLDGGA